MGYWRKLAGALFGRSWDDDGGGWSKAAPWAAHSATGVDVNQATALAATTVMACVTMLCEDFAKLTPTVFRRDADGVRRPAADHELDALLYQPNDWQNWFEFAEMMMLSLTMRGNAYAVKIRDRRARVIKLVPVNADWVALWEAPTGEIFYRVTPNGLHMMAELAGQPFLIPAEDVFHVRGFSQNGLVGASRIALAKEAIGLSLAYERQASQWMGQGASLSGILTTDSKLTADAAKRMAQDWKDKKTGLQNAGSIVVLEQGLKYQPVSMTAADAEFINSRNFQIQEITRIFRIPAHMIGDLQRIASNNLEQLSQEYLNLTLSSYTQRWAWKLDTDFDLRASGVQIEFDVSILTRANITARYNNYARGISGGFITPNEARADDGRDPRPNGDKLLSPSNMSPAGSQASGMKAEGAGRPEKENESVAP